MSATVDGLDQLEAATVALPWPPGVYTRLGMPKEAKTLLCALGEAWPRLRSEIASLEQRVTALESEMAEARAERQRIVDGGVQTAQDLAALRDRHESVTASLAEQLRVSEHQRAAAVAARDRVPARVAAAEKVCQSIKTTAAGPRRSIPAGAHGWFDGSALDEWKRSQ